MRERDLADGVRDGLWLMVAGLFLRRKARRNERAASLPDEPPPPLETLRRGHETTDASAKGLLIFAICMAITLILIALAPIPIMAWLSRSHDRPLHAADHAPLPPSPHLGPPGDQEILEMRKRDLQQLNSYGWVDQSAGIAHVPVETVIPRVAAELSPGATSTDRGTRRPAAAGETPALPGGQP